MDAVWLTEHHFDGAVAYADPLVFGAAVAMRTRRVRIGFAVVEMALHHPVRLAVQTSLLDNLSRGRLIVGTGRGSAYNEFEYIGFGTTMDEGRPDAGGSRGLIGEGVDRGRRASTQGKYWHLSFPRLRPPPYQKPHPPLVRACIGEASMLEMAKHRPAGAHRCADARHTASAPATLRRDHVRARIRARRPSKRPWMKPGRSGRCTWRTAMMRRSTWPLGAEALSPPSR